MKRKIIMMVLFLSVALLFVCNSWAQDIEYECCCELQCCYNHNTWTDPFTLVETCGTTYSKCVPYSFFLEELCEGDFQAQLTCIEIRLSVMDIIISFLLIRYVLGWSKICTILKVVSIIKKVTTYDNFFNTLVYKLIS